MIDLENRRSANGQLAFDDFAHVNEQIAENFLCVVHADFQSRREDEAFVADLAAGFAVKGRLVRENRDLRSLARFIDRLAVLDDGENLRFEFLLAVAVKLGAAERLAQIEPDFVRRSVARSSPAFAGFGALLLHRGLEPGQIDFAALLAQNVLREVHGEAERVVELECHRAGQNGVGAEFVRFFLKQRKTAREGFLKPRLFEQKRFFDELLRLDQFPVMAAHLRDERGDKPVHHRVFATEHMGVAHGAAHDPAQNIAAPLVARHHAVRDQERRGSQMVRDYAVRGPVRRRVRVHAAGFR